MYNKKNIFLYIYIICMCFFFCSCDSFLQGAESGLMEWVYENVDYEYTIRISYENPDDRASMEMRMESFELEITDSSIENGCYTYELLSHYPLSDSVLNLICENPSVTVTDANGEEILAKSDVVSIASNISSSAYAVVSDEFEKNFREKYVARTIYLIVDDITYDINVITKEINEKSCIVILPTNEAQEIAVRQMVISFVSEPLKGNVEMKIEKSATRV